MITRESLNDAILQYTKKQVKQFNHKLMNQFHWFITNDEPTV